MKVNDRVRVHYQLTTDFFNKRGEIGKVTNIDPLYGDVTVLFKDKSTGIYTKDALIRLT